MKIKIKVIIGIVLMSVTLYAQQRLNDSAVPNKFVVQSPDSLSEQIDLEMRRLISDTEPGAAVVATKNGKIVFHGYYGLADLENKRKVNAGDLFCIASLSKHFTGVAVLVLAEDGKLKLDDEITKYFPKLPVGERKITIRRLLSHTSGLPELTQIDSFMSEIDEPHSPEQIIGFMTQGEFRSEPGEKFIYNNTGYTITVALIEKLSGMTYAQFLRKKIFKKLSMNSTFAADIKNPGNNAVKRYEKDETGYKPAQKLHLSNLIGGGSIITNIEDMALWGNTLITGKYMPNNLSNLWKPILLSNGESTDYGLGLGISEFKNHKICYHPGQGDGMDSFGLLFSDKKIYVAVMRNMSKPVSSSRYIAFRVAEYVLGNPENHTAIKVNHEQLTKYQGKYEVIAGKKYSEIIVTDDKIYYTGLGSRLEIVPLSITEFIIPNSYHKIRFKLDEQGKIISLLYGYFGSEREERRVN